MSQQQLADIKEGAASTGPLLQVRDLVKHFPVRGGLLQRAVAWVKAVDGVSFDIRRGETLGLVGESGSGKSTVARTILRLIPPTGGEVLLEGKSVFKASPSQMKKLRRDMQIIFQDPYGSLNPRMSVGEIIGEGLLVHGVGSPREREATVDRLLEVVGLRGQLRGRFQGRGLRSRAAGGPQRRGQHGHDEQHPDDVPAGDRIGCAHCPSPLRFQLSAFSFQ